jgi:glycogen synthase
LRVLMLSWEYPPLLVGGLGRHVGALSRELAARGVRVDVLTRGGSDLPPVTEEEGVTVHRVLPYFGQPADFPAWTMHLNFALCEAAAILLRNVGAREDVVVHAHDWLVAYAGRFIKGAWRTPLVVTLHATEHGRMNGIHDATQKYINDVEWWLTYEAWRVIVCSQSMFAEAAGLFQIPPDKTAVIPNGVDLPEPGLLPDVRSRYALPAEPLLFHVGRLVPEKGAGVLLESLAQCGTGRLVIAGRGPWERELRERALAMGIADRVVFAGFVTDETRQALFQQADLTVVPSLYEPFGIVALEAMAAGAPLVVSDVGGLSEIVRHGVTGLTARPGSPRDLAAQMTLLLQDRALARRLGEAAQDEVRRRYRWSSIAEATEAVYREVLAASRQSVRLQPRPNRSPLSAPEQGRYTV